MKTRVLAISEKLKKWSVLSLAILLGVQTLFWSAPVELSVAGPTDDITAPVISTFSPANGSVTSDGQVEISATFTESESGLDQNSLSLTINDIPVDSADVVFSDNTLSYSPPSSFDDGTYEIQVSIADIATNRSETTTWSFTISSAPSIDALTTTGGKIVSGYINSSNTGLIVSGSLSADSQGAQNLEIYLDGLPFSDPLKPSVPQNALNFQTELNFDQFAELTAASGVKTLTARRIGFYGNISDFSPPFTITVDKNIPTTPEITLNNPINLSNQATATFTSHSQVDMSINYDISDSGGHSVDGGASVNGDGNYFRFDIDLSAFNDGEITASAKATSAAGNVSETGFVTVTKDTVLPALTGVSLVSNNSNPAFAKIGDTISLSFTASEAITLPEVNIAGHLVSVTQNGNDFEAEYSFTEADPIGDVTFSISGFSDLAGNPGIDISSTTDLTTVIFDGTRPEIAANDLVTKEASPSLSGTIDDPAATINITVNDSSYQATNNGDGTWTLEAGLVQALTDGVYVVTAIAANQVGNTGQATASLTVDATDPILSEVTPVTNQTEDTTPDYTFNANEAGSLTYGGSCSSSTVSALAGDNIITFNVLTPGIYSDCTLQITDAVGNQSNILAISAFTIDSETPPDSNDAIAPVTTATVSPSSPDGNEGWYKSSSAPEISLVAIDSESGVAAINYDFDGGGNVVYAEAFGAPEGDHIINFWSKDVAGNIELTQSVHLKVDLHNPTKPASITDGGNYTNNPHLSVSWPAGVDEQSGIDHYLLKIRKNSTTAGLVKTITLGNVLSYVLSDSEAALLRSDNTYYLGVVAVDVSGRLSTERVSDGIILDITAPTVPAASPTGETTDRRPVVQATLTDSSSGVKASSVVVRVNGVAVKSAFNTATGVVSFTPSADLRPRTYYVAVDGRDNAGNPMTRYSFNFTVL